MVYKMKNDLKIRIISAVVALIIVIPLLIVGGFPFYTGVGIIGVIGFNEMLMLIDKEKKLPNFVKYIAMICFITFVIFNVKGTDFNISYQLLLVSPLVILLPLLVYGDNKKYNSNDAFHLLGIILFLGISFHYLIILRNISIHTLLYLLFITIMTDTFAHFFGVNVGKNKLCPTISPNKTIEGMVGGTFFGTFIGMVYYLTFVNTSANVLVVILITLFLSLVAQFGDLVFSMIKRKYDVKDYGNIMPGHGGVIDRLDSIIFAMLAFSYLVSLF